MKYLFFKASTPPFALTIKVKFPERRERRSCDRHRESRQEIGELSPSRSRVSTPSVDAAVRFDCFLRRRRRRSHSRSRSRSPKQGHVTPSAENAAAVKKEKGKERKGSFHHQVHGSRSTPSVDSAVRSQGQGHVTPSTENAAAVKKENGKGRKGSFHHQVHGSRSTPSVDSAVRSQGQGHVHPSAENAAAVKKENGKGRKGSFHR